MENETPMDTNIEKYSFRSTVYLADNSGYWVEWYDIFPTFAVLTLSYQSFYLISIKSFQYLAFCVLAWPDIQILPPDLDYPENFTSGGI